MDNWDCVKSCIEYILYYSMDCYMIGVCVGVLIFYIGIVLDLFFKFEMQFCIVIVLCDLKDIQCIKDEKLFYFSVEYY